MADFTGLDEFRMRLEASGWRIAADQLSGERNECNWYAWMRDRSIRPDCACNDKPPSLTVRPFTAWIGDRQHSGVTLEICGQAGSDWLKLQAYTLTPADFFDRYAVARDRLAAAWKAAAGA